MKLLHLILPLTLCVVSCQEEAEEPCDPAQEVALAKREAELDRREADLMVRERAVGMQSGGNSRNADYGGTTGSSGQARNGAPTTGPQNGTRNTSGASLRTRPEEQRVGYRKPLLFPGQYPEASERSLTAADLEHKSAWGKKVMLNEIYARHGLNFTEADLRKHFNGESWYKGGKKNVDKMLTAVERQNIAFLQANM